MNTMTTQQYDQGKPLLPRGFDPGKGIEYLQLTNIGRFTSMRLEFGPNGITELRGGNGQGKTTIITALIAALTSQRAEDIDKLVHLGEDGGCIETMIAGVKIVKVFRNGQLHGLDVIDESGTKFQKPQTLLDAAFKGTFLNPFDLLAASDRERMRAIAKTIHLDLSRVRELLCEIVEPERIPALTSVEDVFPAIDRLVKTLEEERLLAGRALEDQERRTRALYQLFPKDYTPEDDTLKPVEPQPLGDIHDRLRAMQIANAERIQLATDIDELERDLQSYTNLRDGEALRLQQAEETLGATEDEAALEEQIRRLQQQLAEMQQRNRQRQQLDATITAARSERDRLQARTADLRDRHAVKIVRARELGADEDTSALQAAIDRYEDRMTEYRQAVAVWGESRVRYEQARASAEEETPLRTARQVLDDQVRALRLLPEKMLVGVEMPVDGMLISGDKVFLRSVETDNYLALTSYGEAEQLLFCIRVAMALAPAPFILVDGIERCDPTSSQRLYDYITERGFQAICTRVTDGPMTTVRFMNMFDIERAIKPGDKVIWPIGNAIDRNERTLECEVIENHVGRGHFLLRDPKDGHTFELYIEQISGAIIDGNTVEMTR
jgi:hypothetical protein